MIALRRETRRLVPALVLAALAAGGCEAARHPVAGRVTYEDGSPLPEGSVVGEATIDGKKVMAQGEVKPDGTFAWGTGKAGDGARPGKYKVIVLPRALGDSELAKGERPAVDAKFTSHETSGIEFEVKPGPNELKITVAKPPPKPDPEVKKDGADPQKDADPKKDTDPKKDADPKKN